MHSCLRFEEEADDQLQQKLKRLYNEAGKYLNSRLEVGSKSMKWDWCGPLSETLDNMTSWI